MNQQALLHTSYSVLESVLREAGERVIRHIHAKRGEETITGLQIYCNPLVRSIYAEKIEQILDKYHNEISITKDTNGVLITIK